MESIITNSRLLLEKMCIGGRYTYPELRRLCNFTEMQLCYAILYLLKDGRINQYRDTEVVYELQPAR
ncbi:MAG: hypothetical protein K2G82_01915 [Paramuribaculum sp.]|nr:hypothetical protein [Paramuribaculum sp.]